MKEKIIVFDIDDTLYQEVDYLNSAYKFIAKQLAPNDWEKLYVHMFTQWRNGKDVFAQLELFYNELNKQQIIEMYRTHLPSINVDSSIYEMLVEFKSKGYILGIITDGRAVTQRNKIEALRLDALIDSSNIFISESIGYSKPNPFSYLEFEKKYPNCKYYYIGDNTAKDFITPNSLGWITVGVKDNGDNIHKQQNNLSNVFKPKYWVNNLIELNSIINNNE